MCRARPGPRCSDEGLHRYTKGRRNLEMIRLTVARYGDRTVPSRLQTKLKNAENRAEAAALVYYATPVGQEYLREQRVALEAQLASETGTTRAAARIRRNLEAEIQAVTTRLDQGIERRANSYADLKLVAGERAKLRNQATARGGNISRNAHPLSPVNAERAREAMNASPVVLPEWNADEVSRANTWIDRGAAPALFINPNVHPVGFVRMPDGARLPVGAEIADTPAQSKFIRLNMPDGSVTEARHDFFVTQNPDGKFVVSSTSTVATSWEDASPIDKTKQNLGHMLTTSSPGSATTVLNTYDTLQSAKNGRSAYIGIFKADRVTALMGRDLLTARSANTQARLQERGFAVWHRYREAL